MRSVALILSGFFAASPALFALPPKPADIAAAYTAYRAAICPANCPSGITDEQAQIRLLQQYCSSGGTGVANCADILKWEGLPALSFNHEQRAWEPDPKLKARTELDINGLPTVDLGRGSKVTVVITHTNPLLYAASPGKIELKPIDQLSDLQTLAGLLGGNGAALLQARGAAQFIGTGNSGLAAAADPFVTVVKEFTEAQTLADCVTLSVQAATNFVQAVELARGNDTYPPDLPQCSASPSGSAVRALTQKLGTARSTLRSLLKNRCAELPVSVVTLLALEPPAPATVSSALTQYDAATRSLDCTDWHSGSPSVVQELNRLIVTPIRLELAKPMPDLPTLYRGLRTNQGTNIQKLALAVQTAKATEEPLAKLVGSLPALGKAAENLDLFRERLIQNIASAVVPCQGNATPPPCVRRAAVATFIVVPGGPTEVTKWEFVHTRPIEVAADSPYATDVVSRRGKVATSYNLRSPIAAIFDVGVSVTQTDLQSPTFGAVREDRNNPPTPNNLGDDTKVVGVIDQESQSGKLALMLNVVPLRLWTFPKALRFLQPLGAQIGASADTSKPALFWGLSYGLGKYVRVGWGKTAQRVTVLRDELTPLDTPIADAGEIRKRQKYERDQYWSLMVSIRTLRLFTR